MLTESFVAATCDPEKATNTTTTGIHYQEFQPQLTNQTTFKKSSINANCLAVNLEHALAAQADKAVIHVYNRERNKQEAIVPFQERICSIAMFGGKKGGGTLCLGTESGRLILWEVRPMHDDPALQQLTTQLAWLRTIDHNGSASFEGHNSYRY